MQKTATAQLLTRLHSIGVTPGSDRQLLDEFLLHREEATFAELVNRHGPMVLGVCRRVIGSLHDAEEAFQATFLLLAQKANTIVPRESVGPWLHGVAYRVALKTRTMHRRRQHHEQQAARYRHESVCDVLPMHDLRSILDQELQKLPMPYRLLVILCDLQGGTFRQVARQLDLPVGTLSGRLKRGRELLAQRLARRGIALSTATLALMLSEQASAQVPILWTVATVRAATAWVTADSLTAGIVSTSVKSLVKGTAVAMMFSKLKLVSCVSALAIVLTAGWLFSVSSATTAQEEPTSQTQDGASHKAVPRGTAHYQVQLKVYEPSAETKQLELVTAPKVMVLPNAKATIQANNMQEFKSSKVVPDWYLAGFEAELELQPQDDGSVILQLKAERRRVRVATQGQFNTQTHTETYVQVCQLSREIVLRWEPFGRQGKITVDIVKVDTHQDGPKPNKQEPPFLVVRIIPLTHVDANVAALHVAKQYSNKVSVDAHTNSLVVQGTEAESRTIADFVKHFDVPVSPPVSTPPTIADGRQQIMNIQVTDEFNLKQAEKMVKRINEQAPRVEISYQADKRLLTIKVLSTELKYTDLMNILEAGKK